MTVDSKRDVPAMGALTRRAFLRASLAAPFFASGCGRGGRGDRPPNVVVIVLDTLRAKSLPMYGCPRMTAPFLAELCDRATLFERCYSAASWTVPSITSMLSGLAPSEHFVVQSKLSIPPSLPTYSRVLEAAGYRTGFFSSQGNTAGRSGIDRHFQRFCGEPAKEHDGDLLIDLCDTWVQESGKEPLCAFLHFFEPHGPYRAQAGDVQDVLDSAPDRPPTLDHLPPHYRDVDISLQWGGGKGRIPWYQARDVLSTDPLRYVKLYEGFIRQADRLAREAIARWQARRGDERTVFFITADHGECLGDAGLFFGHGPNLRDVILHVPLIVYDTADPAPRRVSTPVSLLNLAATMTELAETPENLGGWGMSIFPFERASTDREQVQLSQLVGDLEGTMVAWAVTKGKYRLLFDDEPSWGNAYSLGVECGDKPAESPRGYPLPIPDTALRRPYRLAPAVTLETLGVHSPYVEAGTSYGFSGRVQVARGGGALVELRARVGDGAPVELGRFELETGSTAIAGTLGAFDTDPPDGGQPVIIEGRLAGQATWRRLLSFPLFAPRRLNANFELLGTVIEPPVVRPGESFRTTYVWRCLDRPAGNMVVSVHLLDEQGRIVLDATHDFLGSLEVLEDDEPRWQRRKWRKVGHFSAGLRFDEAYWLTVPGDLAPGEYRLRIALEQASAPEAGAGEPAIVGVAVTAATLTVVPGPGEAVRALADRQASLTHVRVLTPEALRDEGAVDGIRAMAGSFADEGHFSYLLAHRSGETERARLLEACLERTPYHLAALAELRRVQPGSASTEVLDRLTPNRECDFSFQGLLRLYGLDLQRAPGSGDALYLTFFWEALAQVSRVYAVKLGVADVGDTEGRPSRTWWHIGKNTRPTYTWKIGEAIVDRLYVPVPADAGEVKLSLRVSAPWPRAYSGKRNLYVLTGGKPGSAELPVVDLGTFELETLPEAGEDLFEKRWHGTDHYLLYDLDADPQETRNLVHDQREVFEELRRELLALVATRRRRMDVPEREFTDEELRRLKSIGYVR